MTREEEDEKDAEKWWEEDFNLRKQILTIRHMVITGFIEGRQTLRGKKLEPNYDAKQDTSGKNIPHVRF